MYNCIIIIKYYKILIFKKKRKIHKYGNSTGTYVKLHVHVVLAMHIFLTFYFFIIIFIHVHCIFYINNYLR